MSSDLYVPILRLPTFSEFVEGINHPLLELSVDVANMVVGMGVGKGVHLTDHFVLVQDLEKDVSCWVSFSFFEESIREEPEQDLPYMAHVFSRAKKNRSITTAIAYAVGSGFGGRIIYDDAHLFLGGVDALPLEDVKKLYLFNANAENEKGTD